jgi:glycosyltransferase involved in cell wall biosynthesis
MRLLLSAYACEPGRGSEEGFGWNWATHLAAEGHEVWVITRPHTAPAIETALRAAPQPNLRFEYVDVPAVSRPLLRGQPGVYAAYFLWQRAIVGQANELVDRHSIDLVHHVTWGTLAGGSKLWALDIPFVFGPVGGGQVTPGRFLRYLPTTRTQEQARTLFTKWLLPHHRPTRRLTGNADLVLATDGDTLALAKRMGAERAELFLDSGLPDRYFADQPKSTFNDGVLNLLWVGRSFEKKALRLSLETAALLRAPFRMTVLGDGPQDDQIPRWLAELGLNDRVTWRGRVPWDEVHREFGRHEVLLFTSLRDSFGSQLLEAMSNGLVVATLNHHGARDFIPDDAGIKVPVTTPELSAAHLAASLDRLYGDSAQLRSMSGAALAFARSHEWSLKARKMTGLYRSVANPGPTYGSDKADTMLARWSDERIDRRPADHRPG